MIIKGEQAATMVRDAVVLDLGDLARQGQRIKEAARREADEIVRQAKEEAALLTAEAEKIGQERGQTQGFKQGHTQGLEQGKAEALAKASEELKRVAQLWQKAAGEVEAQRQAMQREAKQAVLKLALCMAEKVVHRVVEVDETVIVDQVANALGHVMRPLDVTVRIDPTDRTVLENAMPQLLADFAQFQHVRLVDDPVIGAGGCAVSYGQGRVDATIRTQLQRIVELMLPDGTSIADACDDDAPDEGANGDQ